jgi:hypothetical protein
MNRKSNYASLCRIILFMQKKPMSQANFGCAKSTHLDVSWTGDEEDGRLTDEAKIMFSLGRFIKRTQMP